MARDDNELVRDPNLEDQAARELWEMRMRAAGQPIRPRMPAPSGETLPSAPIIPAGRYTGATAAPTVPSPGAGPIAPGPGAPGAPPDILQPPTGTMPRITTPRLTKPQAPVGTQQDIENRLEEARYQREHPMGTLGTLSGKSGVGGKILHTLGRIGNIAGQAVVPNLMPTIPGTDVYNREKEANLENALERYKREASEAGYRGAEKAKTEAETERLRHPIPKRLEGPTDSWTSGEGEQWHNYEFDNGQTAFVPEGENPALYDPRLKGVLPSTGARPTPQGAPEAGTLPAYLQFPPGPTAAPSTLPTPMAPPVVAPPAAAAVRPGAPGGYYGKQTEDDRRLTDAERAQEQKELDRMFQARYGAGKTDPAYQLGPNATVGDVKRIAGNLRAEEATAARKATEEGTAEARRARVAQEEFNRTMKTAEENRAKEKANAEWLHAVDNDGRKHLVTRGDYDAHARDFHPNPGTAAPGEYDKAFDHNTRLGEMQGRMNALAISAGNFNWDDAGQQNIVIQAMQKVEQGWADKLLGVPIQDFIAANLKKLGMSGATRETRKYIVDLLALREAMLGLPKEVTEGSRMTHEGIAALYAALPSETTPDKAWAFDQMRTIQGVLDRLRGGRVPIIDGMTVIEKVPELYQYRGIKRGEPVFSDDNKNWVNDRGQPVK